MTPGFIAAAAALTLIALALLLRPYLLRRKDAATLTQRRINIAIYRDQLDELERDRAGGALSDADYETARQELQRRMLEDSEEAGVAAQAAPSARGTLGAIALAVPLVAVALYALLGTPAALNPPEPQHRIGAEEVDRLVAGLAERLEKEPDNLKGWAMLARSYKALGRLEEAEKAYGRAGKLVDEDPALLVDYADLLVARSGSFAGKPRELIKRALKLEPDNAMALWLAGTDAFESGDYKRAVAEWERLMRQLPPDSEDAQVLAGGLKEARSRAGLKDPAQAGAPKADTRADTRAEAKAAAGKSVSGRVDLAAALKSQAAPGDTVMVVARVKGGPRMPVAVVRAHVSDLPLDFVLDDSLAMSPDHRISSAAEVEVEARVSKSGQATPQKGDLHSQSRAVAVGATGLRLTIDAVR